jgi:hypothetical protein
MINGESRIGRVMLAASRSYDQKLLAQPLIKRFNQIVINTETPEQKMKFLQSADWYYKFNKIIYESTMEYDLKHQSTAVAAVAAVSPGASPETNIKVIKALLENKYNGTPLPPLQAYPANIKVALNILENGDVRLLTGQKVRDFFYSIISEGETDRCPIDRWAAREFSPYNKKITINKKKVWKEVDLNVTSYKKYQTKFQKSADDLGLYAAELQAILWVARRNNGD